jgi:hypothetical protein
VLHAALSHLEHIGTQLREPGSKFGDGASLRRLEKTRFEDYVAVEIEKPLPFVHASRHGARCCSR